MRSRYSAAHGRCRGGGPVLGFDTSGSEWHSSFVNQSAAERGWSAPRAAPSFDARVGSKVRAGRSERILAAGGGREPCPLTLDHSSALVNDPDSAGKRPRCQRGADGWQMCFIDVVRRRWRRCGGVRSERGRSGASLDESVKEEQSNTGSMLSRVPPVPQVA